MNDDWMNDGLDLSDLAELGMDVASLGAADFSSHGALDPQVYKRPARQKIVHPRCVSYDSAIRLAKAIFPLDPGEAAHCVVPGTFVFGDLVEAIAVTQDLLIQELWIQTLSLNAANIESLVNLRVGGYLEDIHLQVSDYWHAHERGPSGLLQMIYDELDDGRLQVSVIRSHGKISLIQAGDARYVIHGSANLRSTSTIENFVVEHDVALFEWHKAWMEGLEDQFYTVNREDTSIHRARCARKGDQWQILDNTGQLTTDGSVRLTHGETEARRPQGPGARNSKEDRRASDGTA